MGWSEQKTLRKTSRDEVRRIFPHIIVEQGKNTVVYYIEDAKLLFSPAILTALEIGD